MSNLFKVFYRLNGLPIKIPKANWQRKKKTATKNSYENKQKGFRRANTLQIEKSWRLNFFMLKSYFKTRVIMAV